MTRRESSVSARSNLSSAPTKSQVGPMGGSVVLATLEHLQENSFQGPAGHSYDQKGVTKNVNEGMLMINRAQIKKNQNQLKSVLSNASSYRGSSCGSSLSSKCSTRSEDGGVGEEIRKQRRSSRVSTSSRRSCSGPGDFGIGHRKKNAPNDDQIYNDDDQNGPVSVKLIRATIGQSGNTPKISQPRSNQGLHAHKKAEKHRRKDKKKLRKRMSKLSNVLASNSYIEGDEEGDSEGDSEGSIISYVSRESMNSVKQRSRSNSKGGSGARKQSKSSGKFSYQDDADSDEGGIECFGYMICVPVKKKQPSGKKKSKVKPENGNLRESLTAPNTMFAPPQGARSSRSNASSRRGSALSTSSKRNSRATSVAKCPEKAKDLKQRADMMKQTATARTSKWESLNYEEEDYSAI